MRFSVARYTQVTEGGELIGYRQSLGSGQSVSRTVEDLVSVSVTLASKAHVSPWAFGVEATLVLIIPPFADLAFGTYILAR